MKHIENYTDLDWKILKGNLTLQPTITEMELDAFFRNVTTNIEEMHNIKIDVKTTFNPALNVVKEMRKRRINEKS